MKILKLYAKEEDRFRMYGSDSLLMRKIKESYDCDEVVLPSEYTEAECADIIRKYDVLLTMWKSPRVPDELADNPEKLKYICNITGEMSRWISRKIVESPYLTITNWGDAPAFGIAEGAFSLLMAVMKNIPSYLQAARQNPEAENITPLPTQTSLYGKRIGIYGIGRIGRKFIEFLKPFETIIYGYDPYAKQVPEEVVLTRSLEELFRSSQIIVIHAGLTDTTRGSVTKELLALLPDGGILINTARGQIVDFEALKAELMSGRLRAGLDMAGEDNMPPKNDPVRWLDNVIFTSHHIGNGGWGNSSQMLDRAAFNCLANLERYRKGEELQYVITPFSYQIST